MFQMAISFIQKTVCNIILKFMRKCKSNGRDKLNLRVLTQNAVHPSVRPYVPPKMAECDFRLMMYLTYVQQFTINTPTVSEFEYHVPI